MKTKISLRLFPKVDLAAWIELWRPYIEEYDDDLYDEGVKLLSNLTDETSWKSGLEKCFEWKRGMPLSRKLRASVGRILLEKWTEWKLSGEVPRHFSGNVWNFFLLHLLSGGWTNPVAGRPIFDQHVWRAYCWIASVDCVELQMQRDWTRCEESFGKYEEWFRSTIPHGVKPQHFDRAVMAFGRFLKQYKPVVDADPFYGNRKE